MQSMTILFLCPSTFKYWDHLWLKSVLHIWLADKQRTSSSRTMRNVTEDSSSCFRLSLEVVLFLDSLRVWMSMYVIYTGAEEKSWQNEAEHCQFSQSQLRGTKRRKRGEDNEYHHLFVHSGPTTIQLQCVLNWTQRCVKKHCWIMNKNK